MSKNGVTDSDDVASYPAIRGRSQEALRRAILDAATRLLVEEGIGALSLRRIARDVGCSTTVLYTFFGGKSGVVEALWLEGFERLWRAEEEAEGAAAAANDPLARLRALGRAYRTHALENPDYYRVMFGDAIPGFHLSAQARERSRRTFQVLVDAVQACIDAGIYRREDPELVASVLWATVHGVVSLQLAGDFREPEAEAIFARAGRAVGEGFLVRPDAKAEGAAALQPAPTEPIAQTVEEERDVE